MNKNTCIFFSSSILIILVIAVSLSVWLCVLKTPKAQIVEDSVYYRNDSFGFTLYRPVIYSDIREFEDYVLFNIDGEDLGPWGFAVTVTESSFESVAMWLASQPKGSAQSAGYEIFADVGNDTFLVTEYVVTDHDGDIPLYSKILFAAKIGNGNLYRLDYRNQALAQQPAQLIPEMVDIAASLYVLEPSVIYNMVENN